MKNARLTSSKYFTPEWLVMALLAVITSTAMVAADPGHVAAIFHGSYLLIYAILIHVLATISQSATDAAITRKAAALIRSLATVATIFLLYATLGWITFELIPWQADATLAWLDRVIAGGISPVLWAEQFISPARVEFFSFIYAFFILYIQLSIIWGVTRRPVPRRQTFLLGFVLTYGLSYLGYLFAPAKGPIVFHAADFRLAKTLPDGFFHQLVTALRRQAAHMALFPASMWAVRCICSYLTGNTNPCAD